MRAQRRVGLVVPTNWTFSNISNTVTPPADHVTGFTFMSLQAKVDRQYHHSREIAVSYQSKVDGARSKEMRWTWDIPCTLTSSHNLILGS